MISKGWDLSNREKKEYTFEEIKNNEIIYSQHFDQDYAESLAKNLFRNINDLYFRPEFIGFDVPAQRNNPEKPLIYFSNHSGMAFPWDAMVLTGGLLLKYNREFTDAVRPLTSPMLSQSVLMNPFLADNFWKNAGAIDATFLNFETMMNYQNSNLLVYPEGVPGIAKGHPRRYQLQRFSSSFIHMSIKHRTDLIPVHTVNGEYINPYNFKSDLLNKIVNKIGIPFLPVGFMTLLIPFQPWLFYFGFPAKLIYVRGNRIKPYEMTDKSFEDLTYDDLREIAEKVRKQAQAELDEAVKKYGNIKYRWGELFSGMVKNPLKFPFYAPFLWPALFNMFIYWYNRGSKKKFSIRLRYFWAILVHNPIVYAFFIPILGWIPIIWKGLRAPKDN